jgi:Protein of unknown function (DUF3240)
VSASVSTPLCRLTLVFPAALEDQMIDELLEHPDWVIGFTSWPVDGHMEGLAHNTTSERVRGRLRSVRLDTVLARANAELLVPHLKAALPRADIIWWTEPVEASGRFA